MVQEDGVKWQEMQKASDIDGLYSRRLWGGGGEGPIQWVVFSKAPMPDNPQILARMTEYHSYYIHVPTVI